MSNHKIKILVSTPKTGDPQAYINAINKAGADAEAKYLPEADTDYDGLLLCGGSDVDPEYYGEKIDGAVGIDADRDAAEFAVIKAFAEAGKPILGICRGHQFLNVFFGGSLYQHLPESDMHRSTNGEKITHEVTADADTIVSELYGTVFTTNSTHHQAVKRIGTGLRATARWENKYVEACEHTTLPIFSVQWHPERMENGAKIFEHFIKLCMENKKD